MQESTREMSDMSQLAEAPRVSVLMITFNHADYLAEAIEGVVGQECDFPFELIIGEDASSDGTREIAFAYQRRYPGLIRVVYSDCNVGMNANGGRIFARARAEYIAFCEGDDFWCARDKLAREVAAIDGREDVGIVHTDWVKSKQERGIWGYDLHKSVHRRVSDRYLSGNLLSTWHFPKVLRTCTVLLRKQTLQALAESGMVKHEYRFGDSVLNLFVAAQWRVAYVPLVSAVYRVSPNSALRSGPKARVRFYESCLQFDTDAREYFGKQLDPYDGYRWESTAGLLVWGLRARDPGAVLGAVRDFAKYFTLTGFVSNGWKAIWMRIPTLRRQVRDIPVMVADAKLAERPGSV